MNHPPQRAACIYCARTSDETPFNREHVIPQSVGGRLYLDDCVCTKCNSRLGIEVDAQLLKLPDIIRAFEALGWDQQRGRAMKHFNVTGDLSGQELKHGRFTGSGFSFPPQEMRDGSVVVPEAEYFDHLRKMVSRDERLRTAGLSNEEISQRLEDLRARYDAAEPGSMVEAPELGRSLLKRREAIPVTVAPRAVPKVDRLIAKVGYEFIFFVAGLALFHEENSKLQGLLHAAVTNDSLQPGLFIMRVEPQIKEFIPLHLIRLEFPNYMTLLRVGFFGRIEYTLTAPALSRAVVESLHAHLNLSDLYGIQFQQQLNDGQKVFLALRESGPPKRLG